MITDNSSSIVHVNQEEKKKKPTEEGEGVIGIDFSQVIVTFYLTSRMLPLFFQLLLSIITINIIHGQQYVIKQDFRSSYQYNSFSVFTNDIGRLIYRIETQYSLTYSGTIKSMLPLNDFVIVARIDTFLGSNFIFTFRILHPRLGIWIDGRISQRSMLIYVIELSPYQQIIVETSPHTPLMSSLYTVRFRDALMTNKIYADYIQRSPWASVYDIRLFSNEYPLELYLVGFAVVQRRTEMLLKKTN